MKELIVLDNFKIKKIILFFFFSSVIYFSYLFYKKNLNINLILTISLIAINYFAIYFYFKSKSETNYFPVFPLAIFYYLLTFTSYFYFYQSEYYEESDLILNKVIIIITLGILSLSIGYFLPNFFYKKKNIFFFTKINNFEYIVILFFIFILFFVYFNNLYLNYSISFLSQLKEPLILFICTFLQLKYLNNKKLLLLIINIIIFSSLFFFEIVFGSVVFPFMIILMIISITFQKNGKIGLHYIMIILLLIFFFHGIKNDIRKQNWKISNLKTELFLDDNDVKLKKKINDTFSIIKNNINETDNLTNPIMIDYQLHRLFHSNIVLQRAVDFTPKNNNFINGASYKALIYKPIPRFIYKDKPREEWGNFWGKYYKILNYNDFNTSWNFPLLVEFYANFNIFGVFFGMFVFGLFIKFLIFFFEFYKKNFYLFCSSCVILSNLVFQESNLSLIVGKIINQFLFFILVFVFILLLNKFIKTRNEN